REDQHRLWRGQEGILREIQKIWSEVKALREDQRRLWEEVKGLGEGQVRLWEEVRVLREDQRRLWEGQNRLWEEVKALREGQERTWGEIRKLWEEVRGLREDQRRLWEGQQRLWEEVRELRRGQERLWRYVKAGFNELRRALGVAFEDYARSFVEFMLGEAGYPEARVERRIFVKRGEPVEVNIFCEDPLVVGEATTFIKSAEEARREVEKLVERVELVQEELGRKPILTVLAVARAPPEAAKALERIAAEHGIRIILGREIGELF
ncbi:MAG: hypothetical protein DRJ67_11985, partial [Thermoprotei archaeon]